jgi:hypothetical protein
MQSIMSIRMERLACVMLLKGGCRAMSCAITAFKSENFQTTTQKAMPAIKKALRLTLPIAVAISSWWPRPDASPRLGESNRMSRNRCAKFVASRALHAILALFVECATAVLRDRHEDAIATYWRAVRRHFAASRATIALSRCERFSSLDHASQLPRDFFARIGAAVCRRRCA